MTLTEFLAARLNEDERGAREALALWDDALEIIAFQRQHDPARVLREVEAKRAILARFGEYPGTNIGEHLQWSQEQQGVLFALEQMAAVYGDHPDYDPSWRLER